MISCVLFRSLDSTASCRDDKNSETSSETSLTLEEVISKAMEGIEYLKACEDFSTKEAGTNLNKIFDAWCELDSLEGRSAFCKHVTDSNFGLLFPKLWTLTECLGHIPDGYQLLTRPMPNQSQPYKSECQGLINLKHILRMLLEFSNVDQEFAASLGKCGAISLLFDGLKKTMEMEIKFPDSEYHLYFFTLYIFAILHNSIHNCSSNLRFYRTSEAVPILTGFLELDDAIWRLMSLLTLAYVVTDEESEMFASAQGGVKVLTTFLVDAVCSSDHCTHRFMGLYASAYELLNAINHLARNDANKKAIATKGAIPFIIQMLQDDFTPEDQRVAAESLWNLSFIPEIRKSDEFQKAVPSKYNLIKQFIWRNMFYVKFSKGSI